MASDYRATPGRDVALTFLVVMDPQPTSPGVKATRRINFGDGTILEQGLYVEWNYNIVEDATQLSQILTPLGLMSAASAEVTIYTRNQLYQYRRYNGTAIRPEANWDNFFARNITIMIRNLVIAP